MKLTDGRLFVHQVQRKCYYGKIFELLWHTLSYTLTKIICRACDRLQPEDSYINGHVFTPHCVYAGQMATVCRCVDGHSLFNCTTDDTQDEIKIFRTIGTDSCSPSDGFVRRRKRDVADQEVVDDDVILPTDFPVPPTPNTTDEFPPPPTWPTASGITEQRAREACLEIMGSSAAYNICSQHVDLEPVVVSCVLNIQARFTNIFVHYLINNL